VPARSRPLLRLARRALAGAGPFGFALLTGGCFGGGTVTRIVDGRVEQGRAIDEEAYAASLRAGIADATGDRERALDELERALAADPDSPELLARYGEIACRAGNDGPARPGVALQALSRAIALDPTYAPAWLGRARCLTLLGRHRDALNAAVAAVENDPADPRATELVASLLFAAGQKTDAWVWLDGLATLEPDSREAQRALLGAALREHDTTREHLAREALARLGDGPPNAAARDFEAAIAAGDLGAARRAGLELGLSSGALALHLAVAAPALALEQATLVLAADPSTTDAWVAGLTAADALGDHARFDAILRELAPEPLPPSALGLELLRALVARHTGSDGQAAFTRALAGVTP
jgi:predicted Zn-dependent protease